MKAARHILTAVATVAFGAAGWWSARMAWADYEARQETVSGTERAIAVMPGNGEYYARLAALTADRDPKRADWSRRQTVERNPFDARTWIELGLGAETAGDGATAERYLLRAAAVDRQFVPRWTLANFYFRQNDTERFWHWAKEAAQMASGDCSPLFRLCARVAEDGRLIERLDIRAPGMRSEYLGYLLGENKAALAGDAARRVAESGDSDLPLVVEACGRMIEAHHGMEAAEIWNGLAQARRIPLGEAKAGQVINGDFAVDPQDRGFDWRLPHSDGISAAREEGPAGLRLTFSGREAEEAETLAQFVPVAGGSRYRMRFRYQTTGIGAGTGLGWRVRDLDGAVLATGGDLSSDGETASEVQFQPLAGTTMVRISLVYRRPQGKTRIEGSIVLRDVKLSSD